MLGRMLARGTIAETDAHTSHTDGDETSNLSVTLGI
jgi:hypothetical protein